MSIENCTMNLPELSGHLCVLQQKHEQSHQSPTECSQTAHSEHICVRPTTQDFSGRWV